MQKSIDWNQNRRHNEDFNWNKKKEEIIIWTKKCNTIEKQMSKYYRLNRKCDK